MAGGCWKEVSDQCYKEGVSQLVDVFRCLLNCGDRWVKRVVLVKLKQLFLKLLIKEFLSHLYTSNIKCEKMSTILL